MPESERRLAAIMFTDMVGFTALGQRNESLSLALLEEQRKLLRPVFSRHKGREVKTMGDAFLVEFPSALDAIRCSYDIQRATREFNISLPSERRLHLRVGVHLGDVVEFQGDISGDAVNVASRIEPLAGDGGVCLTQQVYDHVKNKFELELESLGKRELKNVNSPIEVYRIVMPWETREEKRVTSFDRRRLAVLPLTNISADPNDEYFADGMTEQLISTLSRIRALKVIARTSVMQFKGASKGVTEIGHMLSVGTVLEGSVRRASDRLRITVQLITTDTEEHLWAKDYDRELKDVFLVQSDIAERVGKALKAQLLAREKKQIEREPTESSEAFTLYLKGLYYWNERTKLGLTKAVGYFEKAIEVDPDYARAYLGLADCYLVFGDYGFLPSREAFPKARRLATKALELDAEIAEAHATLGSVMTNEWDWKGSERELKEAIKLDPRYATAHHWYGLRLNVAGRHGEAMAELKRAQELDPLSPIIAANIAATHYYQQRYDEAIKQLKQLLEADPNFLLARHLLGSAYAAKAMFDEAAAEILKVKGLSPEGFSFGDVLAYSYAMSGRRKDAMKVIDELIERSRKEYVSPFRIAGSYMGLDKDKALEWLEKAYQAQDGVLKYLNIVQYFEELHSDPRYAALLRKMGLKE